MKNKSVIALMLAFTMSFTSVCPALAAENTAVESEEVTESEPEEVSEENAVPAEETAPEEQIVSGADEEVTDASSGNQTESVETTEVTEDTEEITDETANVTEETENVTDEAADAAEESKDDTDETTGVAVVDGTTEEYSKKAGEAAAEPEFTGTITITVEGQTAVPDNSGDESPEDLFEQYMSVEFGLSGKSSMRKAKKATGTRLKGNDLAVYQAVAQELPAIAAGKRASTEFELTLDDFGVEKAEWTAEELGVSSVVVKDEQGNITGFSQEAKDAVNAKISFDLHKVSTALLADFPYDLYWFNKSIEEAVNIPEYSTSASTDGNGEWVIILPESITLRFKVAGEFSGADEYTVNTEVGQSVQTAVNNANDIIEQHSGDTDEDKLHNYKDAICNLVSYNDDAAAGNFDFNYGNPWQLLWVFDGIEETKVVCEGYSKAFKYLCDKSSLACILVTGTMDGGTGAGNHMWNIVKLGDKNYLVDVTNCDEGTIGAPDQLFLKREAELNIDNGKEIGYTFHLGGSSVAYSYDEDTLNYYEQNEISLGELQHEHTLVETPAKAATCTEEGNIRYWTCSECRKIFSDEAGETEINLEATVVPVKAHTLTHVEANAATCTDTGNKEHWKCSVCGALFSDEEGTTPTTAEVVEIAATGHTLAKVDAMAATCTDTGNKEHWKCSVCGALFSDEEGTTPTTAEAVEIAATGHTLAKVDAMAATCTDTGNKEHWKCSVCGALFSDALGTTPTTAEAVEIAATGHDLTETEAKAATCTEDGNIAYWTCGTCGKLFKDSEGTQEISQSETIVAASHDLSKTEAKAATCTEAGNIEYWTCSECGKNFSDEKGETEISQEETVVAATGHAWGEWTEVKPATEEEEGLETRTCSNDENHKEERTVHSLEKTEAKDATCTEAGNTEYWKCSRCRKYFSDAEGTTEITADDVEIAATGHTLTHVEAKDATCTEAGNIEYWTCSKCNKLFSDEGTTEITADATVVAAKGHSLEKTEAKAATCTEAGNTAYWTCSECKKLFGDDKGTTEITEEATVVAAKGHSLEKTEAKAATCTEAGNTEYWTCTECKKLFSDDKGTTEITAEDTVVAAKGHSLEKTDAKAATCTEAGNTEYWTCSECKKLFSDDKGTTEITAEDTVVAAKGHSLEKTDAKDATCTEAGNTEYWTCSECEKLFGDDKGTTEITEAETAVAAKGHSLEKTDAKDATCTEDGNTEYWTCSECKKLFGDDKGTTEITVEDTVVAAKGHSLEKTEAKAATCTEAGNTEYWTCSECKKLFGDDKGTTEITVEDTVVAAKGHSLEKTEAKDATCTEAGNTEYWTCGECNKIFSDAKGKTEIAEADTVVAAKGHDWGDWVVDKDATEDEEGLETRTCKNDPSHKEERPIDKLPHTHNLTKTEAKAATCTEAGNIEYWTCSKCEKLYSDEAGTKEITQKDTVAAAKGHSWSGWTVTKKATCTENGSQVRTCSVCKEEETGVIKATGHKWNTAYTVDKKPTASSNGSKSIHCSVCGSIKPGSVQSIPRLTGSWIKDSTGWWYRWSDGTYPAGKFENIGGKTYYFNKAGYMVTGWQYIGGKWYYFDENGAMTRGWLKQGGTWYYLNGSGVMVTGLQNIGGVRYYFNGSGAMQTGWQYIGGKWYYFDGSGAMTRGWLKQGGTWYYLNGSGVMVTGLQNIGGVRYYFNGSGAMQTGWQYIGGKWYYFNGDGAMQTGWRYLGGTWYYMNGSGIMVTGWQQIGGVWYYFNGSGAMQTDWQYIGGKWFYFDGSGAMVTNKWVGDYYLTGSGAMATNTWIGSYYVGADGKWIPGYGARSSSGSSSANASSGIVYWVSGGSVYHSTDRCPALGRSNPSSIMHGTIAESGKPRPCKDCY